MRNNNQIIEYLEKLKSEKELSISEIARRVGMAKSAVSRYFNYTRDFPLNRTKDFAKAFNVSPEDILGINNNCDANSKKETNIDKNIKMIPLIKLNVKTSIFDKQNIESYIPLSPNVPQGHEYYYLRCEDNGMTPTINKGDLVLVCKQNDIKNNEVGAFLISGEIKIRRMKEASNGTILLPDNIMHYSFIILKSDDQILGKVIETIRKVD